MKIPVYQVSVPEYRFINLNKKYADHEFKLWFTHKIPKVYWDNKPDFDTIGKKIDVCLKKHFLRKKVAIRVIGSEEHKGKSALDLIKIIKKIGYDRYNLKRKGDRYENVENKHIDFFALDFCIKPNGKYFKQFIEPFYFWPLVDRGKPIRIDIAIIYDLAQLKRVTHYYEGMENQIKKDGFVFKDPNNKPDAILGIITIL